ncbi:MAG: succinate CoA transferase [Leptospiraceae bacterium]|nr:succinate CoA transferase [Leptospiraceae bacterium]MBL0263665.1 succinate CoA transferase [Leptospiraceae bacterium]MBP9162486.1 succinate CoA transferase [Leptospiraceae bacterium]HRG45626.1 succinate CoA transferase [Leptospiraceae bacterium]HRG73325.1 succinate CoA transferase [Leptospiraceae bacterium]
MNPFIQSKVMTAEDVANRMPLQGTIATSGFTPAGYPKVIPKAYAARIEKEKLAGKNPWFNLYTGASTGDELDGVLARTGCMKKRLPFQSSPDLRNRINAGEIDFVDMHLSHVAHYIRDGILDPIDVAIVEAVDVSSDGRIWLTTSSGMSRTYLHHAKDIYIELNSRPPLELKGFHDLTAPEQPPHGRSVPISRVDDRIGRPYVVVDPDRIKGIVLTDLDDSTGEFKAPDQNSVLIAQHILEFILFEIKKDRIPKEYLPFQSGVGNVANAVLSCIAKDKRFHEIEMWTEVLQDSIFDVLEVGKLRCASTSALTFSKAGHEKFLHDINELRYKFIIRPQEISNHPALVRSLGIIAMNTALEADIYGNVNSTHVAGTGMMNGIGGSGDFARNAYVSIFMAPSVAKGGAISAFVPMVSHVDHTEHDTQIIVSEQGLADIRGLAPRKRAEVIIEKCVHPSYRDAMREYTKESYATAKTKHTPHNLKKAFDWHIKLLETGSMK